MDWGPGEVKRAFGIHTTTRKAILTGNDVFVSLPRGSGKSLAVVCSLEHLTT